MFGPGSLLVLPRLAYLAACEALALHTARLSLALSYRWRSL